ncbi:three-Cys-motif partner protein TcmP [Oxalobacteraceae bacterium OM1]|nr:three-Cys-motif partner protein TcmP [Oxalobacteraceae bacterium OM1]
MAIDPDDGLSVMEVGAWSEDKHALIRRFVHASWAARTRWSQRTYVDLFCGPGKILVRGNNEIKDGSPIVAWKESSRHGGAFTDVFIADLDSDSVSACESRLRSLGAPVRPFLGEAAVTVDQVLPFLRQRGLHLVLLDPFSMGVLDFSILQKLARLKHVDIVLHFSVMDLQRNIDGEYTKTGGLLERFAPNWRNHVQVHDTNKEGARNAYLDYWISLAQSLGFRVHIRAPLFTNSNNGPLYRLVLLYRNDLPGKLWNDVAKPQGQKDFGF